MTPVDIINVDKSTLLWKYFHRFRIWNFTIFDQYKFWKLEKLKVIKSQRDSTSWLNGSPYRSTLLGYSFRRGHNYRNILDLIVSFFLFRLLHNIEMYHTTLNADIQALYQTPRSQLGCMSFLLKNFNVKS